MSPSRLFSPGRQHNRLSGYRDRLTTYTFVFSIFLVAIVCYSVRAQQISGSIRGTITDELGGLILNAKVVARSTSGKEITTATGAQGEYVLSGLAPGLYELRVTAPGFNIFVERDVQARQGGAARPILELGRAVYQGNVTVE